METTFAGTPQNGVADEYDPVGKGELRSADWAGPQCRTSGYGLTATISFINRLPGMRPELHCHSCIKWSHGIDVKGKFEGETS